MRVLFLAYLFFTNVICAENKRFVILITSYNNSLYYLQNLDSVFIQRYLNFRVIYIDDCSTDGTAQLVETYLRERGLSDRCTLIVNAENRKKLANVYAAITQLCDDDEIVIELDGDDWLARDDVLDILNRVYQDDVWLTYGSYVDQYGKKGLAEAVPYYVIQNNLYREYRWCYGPLRTYYTWLFKKIDKHDLMYRDTFFPISADQVYMYPMLEMSGRHTRFVSDILYIYNVQNPLNDSATNRVWQLHVENIIRYRTSYVPLVCRP